MSTAGYVVLASLLVVAAVTVSISINLLLRGSVYRRLKPQSRPRRWVLSFLLILFAAFAVWFPIWMAWPQSLAAKALTLAFAVVFGIAGITLKWSSGLMDSLYERRGWPLR